MKTIAIARFLGINNRLPDTEMRVSTSQLNGQYLRTAVNVEVDNAGRLRRRNGTALIPGTPANPHSLHKLDDTNYLMVMGSAIYAITLPSYTSAMITNGSLVSNATMSFVTIGADTYFSNGTDSGRITAGVAYPMGIPTPSTPPVVAIGGSLLRGWYQVCIAYYNSVTGEEGGVSPSNNTEITATGALQVTLPGTTTGADKINIYVSKANGSVPQFLAQVAVATATYDITALGNGREAPQRYEIPLPAGTLFTSNGRLCSFAGSAISVGLPHRPGYCDAVASYLPFWNDVAVAIECQGGTYIATTEATYWFPGDLGDVQGVVTNPVPFGAVQGTAFEFTFDKRVGWFSTEGVVFADTSGQVEPVMFENIDQTPPASGQSIVFFDEGHVRVVSCGWCVNMENKATTSYSDWTFTSVSGGYGTKADGIYSLDAVGAVLWSFGLGKLSFGSEEFKHLPNVYVGAACPTEIEMTVQYTDERGNDQSYTYLTRGACELLKQQRFDVGRGIRASWFDLSFSNAAGDDLTLATMSFLPAQTSRRI